MNQLNSDLNDLAQIRKTLAKYARDIETRTIGFPRRWQPGYVYGTDGKAFSNEGAWGKIAEILEDETHEVKEIILDNPPGKKGYVMKIKLRSDDPFIYIKVQLGHNCIEGRSFHYDS